MYSWLCLPPVSDILKALREFRFLQTRFDKELHLAVLLRAWQTRREGEGDTVQEPPRPGTHPVSRKRRC
jgi:hypothetical protein